MEPGPVIPPIEHILGPGPALPPGSLGWTLPATKLTQSLIKVVKEEVEGHLNFKLFEYEATTYRLQVVAGENFFVKVHIGIEQYIVLAIYRPLPEYCERVSLFGIESGPKITRTSPIEYLAGYHLAKNLMGGFGNTEMATEKTQVLIDKVKEDVEVKIGHLLPTYVAIASRVQVVAGLNYQIKVNVGTDGIRYLGIFQALPCFGSDVVLHSLSKEE